MRPPSGEEEPLSEGSVHEAASGGQESRARSSTFDIGVARGPAEAATSSGHGSRASALCALFLGLGLAACDGSGDGTGGGGGAGGGGGGAGISGEALYSGDASAALGSSQNKAK